MTPGVLVVIGSQAGSVGLEADVEICAVTLRIFGKRRNELLAAAGVGEVSFVQGRTPSSVTIRCFSMHKVRDHFIEIKLGRELARA